jgi:NADPH-dependent methylglyoxal reductase
MDFQGKSHPTLKFPSDFVPLYARHFPQLASSLPAVPADLVNAPLFDVDASKTEEALGMTFRDPEETVLDTARWLIESGAAEAWKAKAKGSF